MTDKNQIRGALEIALAVGDAIKELGSVPSGVLYAQVMGHMSLETYNKIIGLLVGAGVVSEKNHVLTWIGGSK